MTIVYILLILLIFVLVFGPLFRRIDQFMGENREPDPNTVLNVACEHMDFSDMIPDIHRLVCQYQIKPFKEVQNEIKSGEIDFGLFHTLSVKDISSDFYKTSMISHTDSSDFLDEKLLDQNVTLVTNKKNVQKLVELGIIKKRK